MNGPSKVLFGMLAVLLLAAAPWTAHQNAGGLMLTNASRVQATTVTAARTEGGAIIGEGSGTTNLSTNGMPGLIVLIVREAAGLTNGYVKIDVTNGQAAALAFLTNGLVGGWVTNDLPSNLAFLTNGLQAIGPFGRTNEANTWTEDQTIRTAAANLFISSTNDSADVAIVQGIETGGIDVARWASGINAFNAIGHPGYVIGLNLLNGVAINAGYFQITTNGDVLMPAASYKGPLSALNATNGDLRWIRLSESNRFAGSDITNGWTGVFSITSTNYFVTNGLIRARSP